MEVFCRFAPNAEYGEEKVQFTAKETDDEQRISLTVVDNNNGNAASFACARVFSAFESQANVYDAIGRPLVEKVLRGENCSVFAYGQTSAGKTHSMIGAAGGDASHFRDDHRGIVPRLVEDLFASAEEELSLASSSTRAASRSKFFVELTCIEIYNETVTDLVAKASLGADSNCTYKSTERVKMMQGLKGLRAASVDECLAQVAAVCSVRCAGSTDSNFRSSRSHEVIQLRCPALLACPCSRSSSTSSRASSTTHSSRAKRQSFGSATLVDLAGSESLKGHSHSQSRLQSGSTTDISQVTSGKERLVSLRIRETKNINTSLFALKKVVHCLRHGAEHVPFKDSVLTVVLRESLASFANTSLLACCSSSRRDVAETIATLRFAAEASQIPPRIERLPAHSRGQLRSDDVEVFANDEPEGSSERGGPFHPDVLELLAENTELRHEVELLRDLLMNARTEIDQNTAGAKSLLAQCDRLANEYQSLAADLEAERTKNAELSDEIHTLRSAQQRRHQSHSGAGIFSSQQCRSKLHAERPALTDLMNYNTTPVPALELTQCYRV